MLVHALLFKYSREHTWIIQPTLNSQNGNVTGNHLQAWEASGKGITAYARDHGLKGKSMYASKKSLISKGVLPSTRARFQRVQMVNPVVVNKWLIQLPNGMSVSFTDVDEKVLAAVLNTAAVIE